MEDNKTTFFEAIAEKCSECGICAEACDHLQACGDNHPGKMAEELSTGGMDLAILDFAQRCSLCGLCRTVCPEELDIPGMVKAARALGVETGIIDPEDYRHMWIDHDWNNFSLYRRAYGVEEACADLLKEQCDTLFFPGCMLVNEGPELVQATADWLGREGDVVGASLQCCGAPLDYIGLESRAGEYMTRLRQSFERTGARQIVTACPTCQDMLSKACSHTDMEVVSVFQLMADAGLSVSVVEGKAVTVHDSCTDRFGEIGSHVRRLLGGADIREMAHRGENTICCGSGGIVSAVDPDLCVQRAEERLAEVREAGADMCVTYCMACAHRLEGQSDQSEIRHILELVLDKTVDHLEFDQKNYDMWEGDIGEESTDLLYQSQIQEKLPFKVSKS